MMRGPSFILLSASLLATACGPPSYTRLTTDSEQTANLDEPTPSDQLSQRPKPRGKIKAPEYSPAARKAGVEGRVLLQVFIDKQGIVRWVKVVEDPGGGLGDAAASSMRKERWRPAVDMDGSPVSTIIMYTYFFVLKDQDEAKAHED